METSSAFNGGKSTFQNTNIMVWTIRQQQWTPGFGHVLVSIGFRVVEYPWSLMAGNFQFMPSTFPSCALVYSPSSILLAEKEERPLELFEEHQLHRLIDRPKRALLCSFHLRIISSLFTINWSDNKVYSSHSRFFAYLLIPNVLSWFWDQHRSSVSSSRFDRVNFWVKLLMF